MEQDTTETTHWAWDGEKISTAGSLMVEFKIFWKNGTAEVQPVVVSPAGLSASSGGLAMQATILAAAASTLRREAAELERQERGEGRDQT